MVVDGEHVDLGSIRYNATVALQIVRYTEVDLVKWVEGYTGWSV